MLSLVEMVTSCSNNVFDERFLCDTSEKVL